MVECKHDYVEVKNDKTFFCVQCGEKVELSREKVLNHKDEVY